MLVFKGKLNAVFKRADYHDKKSGEIKPAKYQLEFLEEKEMIEGQGKETVIQKISIPDNLYPQFKEKVGQMVEVPIDAMVNNNRVIFYGVSR